MITAKTAAPTAAPTTANDVSLFKFKDAEVRVVKIDGEPWFVATDVFGLLYGRTTGHSWVRSALGEDERTVLRKQREPNSLSYSQVVAPPP